MLAWTYSKAGVNIDRADLAKKSIAKILGKTYSKKVLQKIGQRNHIVGDWGVEVKKKERPKGDWLQY